MNADEVKSLLVKMALVAVTPLATKFHIDGNTTYAIITDLVDAGIMAYGIYSHWNMKKVPETATVVGGK